jgi:hypothetical protein
MLHSGNCKTRVFANVSDALAAATVGDGLLVMAEGMLPSSPGVPQKGTGAKITNAEWSVIDTKGLFVYLEFPTALRDGVLLTVSAQHTRSMSSAGRTPLHVLEHV